MAAFSEDGHQEERCAAGSESLIWYLLLKKLYLCLDITEQMLLGRGRWYYFQIYYILLGDSRSISDIFMISRSLRGQG
jgi:hypothetical protein